MSLLKKLAGETLIYGSSYVLGRVLHYLVNTFYLTRVFDGEQEQYGLYSDFYFYVAFLLVLLTLRMETAFFRFGSKKDDRDEAFSAAAGSLLGTALMWAAVLFLFYKSIATALSYPDMGTHVLILGSVLIFDILVAIPFARLRLENRPIRFAIFKVGGILINIFFLLFFLEVCPWLIRNGNEFITTIYHEENRLLYVFISNLIASGFVWLFLLPKYFQVDWKWSKKLWKKMILYALPLILVGVAGVINQSSYITFQKYILPNSLTENLSEGGIYAAAAKLAILMNLFTIAFNYAAEPFFFQHADRSDNKQIYAQVARAFSAVGAIMFVGILLYMDLVQLILGKSFRSGLEVVPILMVAYFMLGIYYNFSIWYKLKDKTHLGALISLGGAIITIILNILLIQKMEVIGSAWAALACYFFMVVVCYLWGRKYFPVPYPIGRMVLHIVLAIGVYLFSEWMRPFLHENLFKILLVNTLLVITFIGVIWKLEWKHLMVKYE
jgi:O-antigen/teichoic acid export membrane protein